jgi:hypothetical protein
LNLYRATKFPGLPRERIHRALSFERIHMLELYTQNNIRFDKRQSSRFWSPSSESLKSLLGKFEDETETVAEYLLLHGEEGLAGGVEEDAAVPQAEDGALDLEHEAAVGVGDGEVAVGDAEGLLGHRQRHHVRGAELVPHHRQRRRWGWGSAGRRERHRSAGLVRSL